MDNTTNGFAETLNQLFDENRVTHNHNHNYLTYVTSSVADMTLRSLTTHIWSRVVDSLPSHVTLAPIPWVFTSSCGGRSRNEEYVTQSSIKIYLVAYNDRKVGDFGALTD
jgi:hypothetical protein